MRSRRSRARDLIAAEASPKAQPWAETAAPPASDKRPLESVLAEYEARVAATPGARAGHPNEPHPGRGVPREAVAAPTSRRPRPESGRSAAGRADASAAAAEAVVAAGRWRRGAGVSEIVERQARALEGVLFDYGETLVEFVRPEAALAAADARIVDAPGGVRVTRD